MDADTFDRIMIDAIAEEVAARDFYKEAAGRIDDASVKKIFEGLSRDEEHHRVTLETFRFNPIAKVEFERVKDYKVAESEKAPALSFELTPKEAFQIAMKKEQRSLEIYQSFADQCESQEVKKLYLELAEMERGHKAKLEELFTNAAYPEVW
jgi:rubrerythrin